MCFAHGLTSAPFPMSAAPTIPVSTRPPWSGRCACAPPCRWRWRRRCCCSGSPISSSGPPATTSRTGCSGCSGPRAWWPRRSTRARRRHGPVSAPATWCSPSTARRSRRARTSTRSSRRPTRGTRHVYTLLTLGDRRVAQVTLAPIPRGVGSLYYVLAGVGIFSLLVGATVRTRRPADEATLHFFWLAVAFFGVFTFSFSGRLDRVDWVFYWADQVATLLLPPLFFHFGLVFPERPRSGAAGDARRQGLAAALPAADRPRRAAGQRAGPRLRGSRADDRHDRLAGSGRAALRGRLRDRRAGGLRAGAAPRPLDHDAATAPLDRVGHGDRRRAVRLSPTPSRSRSAPSRRWRWN